MFLSCSNKYLLSLLTLTAVVVTACGGGGGGGGQNQPIVWLIPTQDIADGGPGVDGIPALQNPIFEPASSITDVQPNDLVIALRSEGQVKVYPHDIMDYHEIVNDGPADQPLTMSYCPLTGSAVAWHGTASHADSSFGVSGFLYNSNLLLYDRETESLWSQMLQLAVNGPRLREVPSPIQVIETTFATLKMMYPDAMVMSRDTGHVRVYDDYPYGDYKNSDQLLFRVSRQDNRMLLKQRVIGIYDFDESKVYQLGGFSGTQTINDQFKDQSIVVVGNSLLSFGAIYSRELADGTILAFEGIQDDLPNVMTDTEGNVWDIFGKAVSGPRVGTQLELTQSYTAMWFAWIAHFRQVEIFFNSP